MSDRYLDDPPLERFDDGEPGPLRREDADHLRILGILHYVSAGLSLLGTCAFGAWTAMIFTLAGMEPRGGGQPPPEEFVWLMGGFGVAMVLFSLATVVAQALAGRNLHRRTGRTLVLVVAALECLNMPLGTILGVFTFVVLGRPSVRAAFAANDRRPDPYRPAAGR